MCFNIRNNKECATLWVAQEDITCYKVLTSEMLSPYQRTKYVLGTKYKAKILQPETADDKGNLMFNVIKYYTSTTVLMEVGEGLHSYTNLKAAKSEKSDWTGIDNVVIVKCVIPKGSEFYYDSVKSEYVSNQIIAQKIIK